MILSSILFSNHSPLQPFADLVSRFGRSNASIHFSEDFSKPSVSINDTRRTAGNGAGGNGSPALEFGNCDDMPGHLGSDLTLLVTGGNACSSSRSVWVLQLSSPLPVFSQHREAPDHEPLHIGFMEYLAPEV